MKKILFGAFILLALLFFTACSEDDGSSMNEDYAGNWYGDWGPDNWIKLKLTDTTYEAFWTDGDDWFPSDKGTVEKTGENSVTVTLTHEYDDGWDDVTDEPYDSTYNVSADGMELILYNTPVGEVTLHSLEYFD